MLVFLVRLFSYYAPAIIVVYKFRLASNVSVFDNEPPSPTAFECTWSVIPVLPSEPPPNPNYRTSFMIGLGSAAI